MYVALLCPVRYIVGMAKLTRSNSKSALADGQPHFHEGGSRFSIGITASDGSTYHLHLTDAEAHRFAAFVTERGKAPA
jgi:hypothetical protein